MTCTTSLRVRGASCLGRLPGGEQGVLQHPALDELPGLQGVVGLLDQVVPDAVLSHDENGVDAVGQAPQLGPLFACQFS